jgi:hypothetical protein
MKKLLIVSALVVVIGGIGATLLLPAQDNKSPASFEYAIVRWEDPDLLFRNVPTRSGLVADSIHVSQQGASIPKEALREEYCQTFACNLMAKTGWEPFNLDGNRIIFRRVSK